MIPSAVIAAITHAALPCFVYDTAAVAQRAAAAAALVDYYYYPIKACPELEVVRAALSSGSGLDLCSEGDVEIALATGCPGNRWKFTSACASTRMMRLLREVRALLVADSQAQALRWGEQGGKACGLRITATPSKALYGAKFGIPACELSEVVKQLTASGVQVEGLHLHDQHTDLSPSAYTTRLIDNFTAIEPAILRDCRYINVGGSWPMRFGVPATESDLRESLRQVRDALRAVGFVGALHAEPGRWVAGPCGYWAARVAAVKAHPAGADNRVVILDTSTPVPSKPALTPFAVVRDGALLDAPRRWNCYLFGSANTALDLVGEKVRLPEFAAGDIVVALGQGAYTRSLIPPFNERERPAAITLGG